MRKILIVAALAVPLMGCNTLRKIPGIGGAHSEPANIPPLPDDYTVTGTTVGNFDFIPINTIDRTLLVRVNRTAAPETGWHTCDQFEIFTSTKGTGGGGVRFGFLNLVVGGVSFPVAPRGTQYEIRSITTRASRDLY